MQHLIAHLVAVGVVDTLEVIDIQQQERQRRRELPRPLELGTGAFKEVPAVAALGQHIGGGQALQLAFELLLLGDVLGDTHDDRALATVGAAAEETLVAQPAQLPVATDDAVLAGFHRALVEHGEHALLREFEVIRIDRVAPLAVIGQQQGRRATEDAFVGRADVDHPLRLPVERPEHGVDAAQQGAEQLLALAQAGSLRARMHQCQQCLRIAAR